MNGVTELKLFTWDVGNSSCWLLLAGDSCDTLTVELRMGETDSSDILELKLRTHANCLDMQQLVSNLIYFLAC